MIDRTQESQKSDQYGLEKGLPPLKNQEPQHSPGLPRLPKGSFGVLPPISSLEPVSITKVSPRENTDVQKKPQETGQKNLSSPLTKPPVPNPIEHAIESLIFTLEAYDQDDLQVLLAMTRDPLEACLIKKIYNVSRRRQHPVDTHGKKSNRNAR